MMEVRHSGLRPRLAPIKAGAIVDVVQYGLFAVAIVVYLSGLWLNNYTVQFAGTMIMLVSNIAFSLLRLETRLLSLLLYLGMFLFWLTRPLFGITYKHDNYWGNNGEPSLFFALFAILLTLFFVRLGTVLYEGVLDSGRNQAKSGKRQKLYSVPGINAFDSNGAFRKSTFLKAVRITSLVVYAVCYVGSVVYGYQQLSFMRSLTYEEFYLTSSSAYSSGIIAALDSMAPIAMCFYLATGPSKIPATIVLLLNVVSTGPELIIGSRGPFVLAVVFLGFYYLLRAYVCKEEGWITKFEIALVCAGFPLGILGMGAMNYIRGGHDIAPEGIVGTFCDALYKQGVTFSVLQYAFNVDPQIQNLGFRFYTIGQLTNTITQGFVGQLFLGAERLPETNSIELALNGTLYSHTMSYFAHWNYLGGEGYGTSYLLEAYADFGYGGIVGVSVLYGYVFASLSHKAKDGSYPSIVFALLVARQVFYIPRGETLSWLSFMWSTRFWAVVAIVALIGFFLCYRFRKQGEVASQGSVADIGANGRLNRTADGLSKG